MIEGETPGGSASVTTLTNKGKEAKMELTAEQEREYLKSPNHCPYCGSENIDSGHMEGDTLTAQVVCRECDKSWWDCYQLTEIMTE